MRAWELLPDAMPSGSHERTTKERLRPRVAEVGTYDGPHGLPQAGGAPTRDDATRGTQLEETARRGGPSLVPPRTAPAASAPRLPSTRRSTRARLTVLGLAGVLGVVAVLAAGVGAVEISPRQIAAILGHRAGLGAEVSPSLDAILLGIRLPRVILGALVGAAIALCGVLLQGLFRNPLADPSLLGISSGAGLVVAFGTVYAAALAPVHALLGSGTLPAFAFVGALTATFLVRKLGGVGSRTDVGTLLLAGIALTALAEAGTGLLSYVATDNQLRSITAWRLGSLGGATWTACGWVALPVAALVVSARRFGRPLDALLLGEREAAHLGIEVEPLKRKIVVLASFAVGASVAAAGVIGFVGLVVPHLVRLGIGPGHRHLIPASALGGAVLLVAADLLARTALAPAELPIGVITSAIGAPFFAALLLRIKRGRTT